MCYIIKQVQNRRLVGLLQWCISCHIAEDALNVCETQPKTTSFFFSVKASDVLWNLYSYYKTFIPCIEQSLQEARKPIEKELKVCDAHEQYSKREISRRFSEKHTIFVLFYLEACFWFCLVSLFIILFYFILGFCQDR